MVVVGIVFVIIEIQPLPLRQHLNPDPAVGISADHNSKAVREQLVSAVAERASPKT